jgi:hypothetical protein
MSVNRNSHIFLQISSLHTIPNWSLSKEICKHHDIVYFNVHLLYAEVSFCQ